MTMETIRVSSKGQVVIPVRIRRQLKLSTGDEPVVAVGATGGTIVLSPPLPDEITRVSLADRFAVATAVVLGARLHTTDAILADSARRLRIPVTRY